uniref:Uncharacterized protein n=1 Tax=Setaria viridis TaxID=4556 RepID=A0A4V6D916_SETVI|nr:hypothetical protein SEVIR_3G027400v2 [Setaria viridis]
MAGSAPRVRRIGERDALPRGRRRWGAALTFVEHGMTPSACHAACGRAFAFSPRAGGRCRRVACEFVLAVLQVAKRISTSAAISLLTNGLIDLTNGLWERDGPGGRREAVLLLRLPQQVPERRVAEVRQLHHEPPRAAPAAFHAHRHVPRRHRGAGARGGGLRCGGGAGPPPAHGAAQPDERRDRDHDLAHA